MLWLVWHMWILIGLAFAGGVIAGWVIRGRSDDKPERPMLETLDATVVAPVEPPKAEPARAPEPEAQKPVAQASAEPKPEPKPAAGTASPAKPEQTPKPATKSKAAKPKSPKPKAADEVPPPPPVKAPADDLTVIKGLGPKAAAALKGEGVTRFAQVAAWSKADVERFDALINGRGRIVRDDWVRQAKALAKA